MGFGSNAYGVSTGAPDAMLSLPERGDLAVFDRDAGDALPRVIAALWWRYHQSSTIRARLRRYIESFSMRCGPWQS